MSDKNKSIHKKRSEISERFAEFPEKIAEIPTKLKDNFRNAVRTYRQNFKQLFLPLLVFQVILLLPFLLMAMPGTVSLLRGFLEFLTENQKDISALLGVLYMLIAIVAVALLLSPLIIGCAVHVIDCDFNKKETSFRESLRYGRASYWAMLKSYCVAIVSFIPALFLIIFVLSRMFYSGFDLVELKPLDIFILILIALGILLYFMGTIFIPYTVISEKKGGFSAVRASFAYVYRGNFLSNLSRLLLIGMILVVAVLIVKWLTTLPFKELIDLYMINPQAALREPLMIAAIMVIILGLFVTAFVLPFWYAFSYNTYRGAKFRYEKKMKGQENKKSNQSGAH